RLFSPDVAIVNETYQDGDSKYVLRILQPRGIQKPLPAVILYHGTTPKGEEHQAMNMFGGNLATIGARVYIPELPILKQALVKEETVSRMKRIYGLIASRGEVREDRIVVAGFSFAGGLTLKACTEAGVNPVAIICYGSYYDLETALRYFLTGRAQFAEVAIHTVPHEYARAVFFWNYMDQMDLGVDVHRLRECMHLFITDQHDKARVLAASLGERERAFANMAFDPNDKKGIDAVEQILPVIRNQLESLSPKYFLDQISAPIFLVHGEQDIMIPYTETLALARALEQARKEHHVHISKIYSHSDPEKRSLLGFLAELKALMAILNHLFKYLL
ncbi:MAG: hypothetical protein PVG99_02715, partial [Desulfobacteraceae bacterium]